MAVGVGRPVAFKYLVRQELLDCLRVHAAGGKLGAGFVLGLSFHQGLGLGKEIGQQDLVMLTHGVLGLYGGQEVRRHQLGSLMDELIEGMLAVRAWFTPDHRTGLPANALPLLVHGLAVTLHVGLLQIGGQPRQPSP